MLKASQAGCINHPGMTVDHRCKQCAKGVCNSCVFRGPTGVFCSEVCKIQHENYMQRAGQLDSRARSSFFVKVKSLVVGLLVLAAVIGGVGFAATEFKVPIVSDIAWKIREMIGL